MQLHEQTRRLIALTAFFLLGPVLTLVIIGAIVVRKLPDNAKRLEYALSMQTGLHWSVESVEYREPNTVRLHKVQLYDNGNAVFIAPEIDIGYVSNNKLEERFPGIGSAKQSPNVGAFLESFAGIFPSLQRSEGYWQISIRASAIKLDSYPAAASAEAVRQILGKVFSRFEFLAEVPVQISLEQVAVVSEYSLSKGGENYNTLRFVQGNLYRTNEHLRSDWTFQIKDVSETETERLSFVRPLAGDFMTITFQSGKQAVPCLFAAVFCPAFQMFSGGGFTGTFTVNLSRNSNEKATVRLDNVVLKNIDLAPLAKPYTKLDVVSGTITDLTLKRAVFGGCYFQAEGHFLVTAGSVDAGLFNRIVDNFRLTVEPSSILESLEKSIPFTACAVHFRLQPDGMAFWADELWLNAFIHDTDSRGKRVMIAFMPPGTKDQTVSYQAVLSIFAPDTAPVVPLTSGLQKIFSVIPAAQ